MNDKEKDSKAKGTSLGKLSICGVRSFSPYDDHQVIKFENCLTVIVGQNGCGKTTIIECLRNCCSGAFPPGAQGKMWIHDTQLVGSDVKAQLRLQFWNKAGKRMVASRSYQCSKKAKTVQFKGLDNVLMYYDNNGERISKGYTTTEMNETMPNLLGVSRAIIENVIFCHQEDTTWPMAESSVLKKRFDEIFESTRYSKGIENIKSIKKEKDKELHSAQLSLATKSEQVKQANKLKSDVESLLKQESDVRSEVRSIEDKIKNVAEEVTELKEKIKASQQKRQDVKFKAQIYREKHKSVEEMKAMIEEEYDDDDEDLFATEDSFEAKINKYRDELKIAEEEHKRLSGIFNQHQQVYQQAQVEYSAKSAAQKQQEGLLNQFKQQLVNLSRMANVAVDDNADTMLEANRVRQIVQQQLSSKRNEFNAKREDNAQKRRNLEKTVQDSTIALRNCEQQLSSSSHELEQQRRISESLATKLNHTSGTDCSAIDGAIVQAQNELREADCDNRLAELNNQRATEESKLDSLKRKKQELRSKIASLRHLEAARHRIQEKENQLAKKKQQLSQSEAQIKPQLSRFINPLPPTDKLQTSVDGILGTKQREMNTAQTQFHDAQGQLHASEKKKTSIEKKLNSDSRRLKQLEESLKPLFELCEEYEVDQSNPNELLETIQSDLEKAVTKKEQVKGYGKFLQRYLEFMKEHDYCPTCRREFDDVQDMEAAIEDLTNKIESLKDRKSAFEKVDALTQHRDTVQALIPRHSTWIQLRDSMKMNKRDFENTKRELAALEDRKAPLENSLKGLTDEIQALQCLRGDCGMLTTLFREVSRMQSDIDRENASSENSGADSLADIERQLEQVESQQSEVLAAVDAFRTQSMQVSQRQMSIQKKLGELHNQKAKWQQEQGERQKWVVQLDQATKRVNELQERIERLQQEAVPHKRTKTTSESELKHESAGWGQWERTVNLELSSLETEVAQLTRAAEQLNHIVVDEEAMAAIEKTVNDAKISLEAHREELQKCNGIVNNNRRQIEKRLKVQQELKLQCDYRRAKIQLKAFKAEVQELSEEVKQMVGGMVDIDQALSTKEHELQKLQGNRSRMRGQLDQVAIELRNRKSEISRKYGSIDEEHKEALIESETLRLAAADLIEYQRALENALIDYHSMKLEEINRIIQELWTLTYRGQDIDRLMIQSQVTGAAKRRSYKLMMKKGDATMDMRGRCSAGQKVLASMVIRLALAEAFCANCGVLTLDEPTTNLDEENKISLATALTSLIERRYGENFQLVIITHDEQFVQMIGRGLEARPEFYYRVSRKENEDGRFNSHIEQMEWTDDLL
eukprot:TRINITY_DN2306_c0_g1_i3.p1 TRINITY_DN2306_c0_g1~~TRINITY_DN2306_c0_g1_i3.p1  ORF type:complete len:1322 (+),score=465.53 TRINITY_DN2306_c0_g1_i3:63-4028(+)